MDSAPIALLESETVAQKQLAGPTIPFRLDILGKELRLCFAVTRSRVRLPDLVPLARTLCTRVTKTVLEQLAQLGQAVPCHKGCPVCCNHLVPLSVPEALAVVEQTSLLPQPNRSMLIESCLSSARQILKHGHGLFNAGPCAPTTTLDKTASAVADWYAALQLSCPFLSDAACTIYPTRPLACREHFVVGSASLCANPSFDVESVVPMPVSVLNALAELTARLEQSSLETVILPLTFAWAEQNADRSTRTWPATFVAETFADVLTSQACRHTEVAAAS